MSKLFSVHIRVQGRQGDRVLTYVRNFAVFFLEGLPQRIRESSGKTFGSTLLVKRERTLEELQGTGFTTFPQNCSILIMVCLSTLQMMSILFKSILTRVSAIISTQTGSILLEESLAWEYFIKSSSMLFSSDPSIP